MFACVCRHGVCLLQCCQVLCVVVPVRRQEGRCSENVLWLCLVVFVLWFWRHCVFAGVIACFLLSYWSLARPELMQQNQQRYATVIMGWLVSVVVTFGKCHCPFVVCCRLLLIGCLCLIGVPGSAGRSTRWGLHWRDVILFGVVCVWSLCCMLCICH